MCILANICRCLCGVNKKNPNQPPNDEFFTINDRNPEYSGTYAVPLALLPPNFDLNQPGVTNLGDYVLVKDLAMIHTPMIEEYQRPLPYNPQFMAIQF